MNRDERQFPSAVPPAIRLLKAQLISVPTHHRPLTEVTRPTLLSLQAAAPGRKPGIARKRLSPSRSRFCANQYKAARSQLFHMPLYTSTFPEKCKYFFVQTGLDDGEKPWYGTEKQMGM